LYSAERNVYIRRIKFVTSLVFNKVLLIEPLCNF